MILNAAVSAVVNVVILAGIPFLLYVIYHKWRHKRAFGEIATRAGLQLGETRYIGYCLAFAAVTVGVLIVWSPPVEPYLREGSSFRRFAGLGLGGPAGAMALLHGLVATGFAEEFLFRGLIAGSLSRRLRLLWANVWQAIIFTAPHVLVLLVMPELWGILPVVFAGSLFLGWARIKSGSMIGPWLVHAAANVATCLMVAARSTA